MPVSSYQVERLIDRLRQIRGWLPWPAYLRWRGEDPVRLSQAARGDLLDAVPHQEGAGPVPPLARTPVPPLARTPVPPLARTPVPPLARTPVPPLAAVRDGRRYPPVVEQERERRAGSFMEPPYLDPAAPGRLPKLGPRSAARRGRGNVAKGD